MKNSVKNLGLTLLELLVVISIVAILALVAVPTLDSTVKTNSVRSLHRTYLSAFAYARGEAVSRNKMISLCPSVDEETCSEDPADWSRGWLVFVDDAAGGAANGSLDAGEQVLRAQLYRGSSTASFTDPDSASADLTSLTWNYRGYTDQGQRALLVVCPSNNEASYARALMVERTGRVMQSRAGENNVHEVRFDATTNVVGDTSENSTAGFNAAVTQPLSCG